MVAMRMGRSGRIGYCVCSHHASTPNSEDRPHLKEKRNNKAKTIGIRLRGKLAGRWGIHNAMGYGGRGCLDDGMGGWNSALHCRSYGIQSPRPL